jgi:gamma-glutamylputrescine oxidase
MSLSGSFLHSNDQQGKYPPSYYHATANPHEALPHLQGDLQFDVCIVGAGYMGLSSALHLAEHGYKVAVLEAHRVGWGASGRNGGQVGSGMRKEQDELEDLVGLDHARQLWDIAESSKATVKSLISKYDIQCDLKPGILHADHKKRYVRHSKAIAEKLQSEYDYHHIRFVDGEEIREMVGSNAYYGGTLDMDAAHLHPLNFALGLSDAARSLGAEIFENSQVLNIQKGLAGNKVKLETAHGSITASHVIMACNGYMEALIPKVAARVMPMNNCILATEPLSEDDAKALIRDDVAVADSEFVINYFRLSADKRMLFGGGENYSFKFPSDIKAFVTKPMLEIYPQLKDVKVDYAWAGTLGITLNRMPYITKIEPNILNASGFSGHGVAMATQAGQILAEAIDGQASRFDVMEKVPIHIFPGGRHLRWPLMVLGMFYYSLRDKL